MTEYTITIETTMTGDIADDDTDRIMDALADLHPAIGLTHRGTRTATVTTDGSDPAAALAAAIGEVTAALGGEVIDVEITRTDVHDERADEPSGIHEYVSTNVAAQMLGTSRQRVAERVNSGQLPATRIEGTRTQVIPRAAVTRLAARMAAR